ncbi:unnamed protein product, partial [marine sediment metagenome]
MQIGKIRAIDVHVHIGRYGGMHTPKFSVELLSGSAEFIIRQAYLANTEISVIAPYEALRGNNPVEANKNTSELVARREGLLQWIVINPKQPESFDQALDLLKLPKSVGIKVHSEDHNYQIAEYGERIFQFAAEHHAILAINSGERESTPEFFAQSA